MIVWRGSVYGEPAARPIGPYFAYNWYAEWAQPVVYGGRGPTALTKSLSHGWALIRTHRNGSLPACSVPVRPLS